MNLKNVATAKFGIYTLNIYLQEVTNIIALWDPEVIVFGGGLSNQFDRFYSSLVKYLNKQKFFQTPRLEKASLSDESGLYGGLVRLGNCDMKFVIIYKYKSTEDKYGLERELNNYPQCFLFEWQ
jgi:hypothetical protein